MFNKRRASTGVHMPRQYNQPPIMPQSSTAATAATTAFNKKASTGGLSSAAAAAALRNHPSLTPQLGDIQTKRLQRRGSNGSDMSRYSIATIGHTQNIASTSRTSLLDRSLRSPSPAGRGSPSQRPSHVPPIPAIPDNMITSNAGRQRSSSLENMQRTPSSASRSRTNRRGASMGFSAEKLDRLKQATMNQRPELAAVKESSSDSTKRLVNFSRPMSPQNSPKPKSSAALSRTVSDAPQQGAGGHMGPIVSDTRQHHDESVSDLKQSRPGETGAPPLMQADRASQKLNRLVQSTTGSVKKQELSWRPTAARVNSLETSKWSDAGVQTSQAQPLAGRDFASDQRLGPIVNSGSGSNVPSNESLVNSKLGKKTAVIQNTLPEAAHANGNILPAVETQKSTSSINNRARRSPSPSKVMQFDIASNDLKYQPLGRSASPAKSALKSSSLIAGRPQSAEPATAIAPSRKKSVRINLEVVPGKELSGLAESKHAPKTVVRSSPANTSTFDDDMNGLMRPRPALPFFGSVRRNSRENVAVENATPIVAVSNGGATSASQHSIPSHRSPLKGKGTRRDDSELITTTGSDVKEEVGDDEDLLNSDDEDTIPQLPSLPVAKFMAASKALRVSQSEKAPVTNASIVEESLRSTAQQPGSFTIPGSFPGAEEHKSESATTPEPAHVPVIVVIPTTPPVTKTPFIPEDDSDSLESSDDEVYEDAEEELENYEFASLDQILEEPSPEVDNAPNEFMAGKTRSPLLRQESGDTLALERRLEEARLNSNEQERAISPPPKSLDKPHNISDQNVDQSTASTSQARDNTGSPTSLRSSKWNPENASQQPSEPPRQVAQPSVAGFGSPARGRTSKQALPAQSPTVIRQRSADSVSSFRKSKLPTRSDGGYSLRQSMRSSSASGVSDRKGRTSRRPMSPDDSSAYNLRTSLRSGTSPSSTTSRSITSWRDRLTSPSRMGNKLRAPKEKKDKQSKPRFGRRFSNTSVAESTSSFTPNGFVSRFADDSDDENFTPPQRPIAPLTPVRGIPRKRGVTDGDSTDLEDSDENRSPAPITNTSEVDRVAAQLVASKAKSTNTATGTQGLASSRFAPTRPSAQKRWSSFLGVGGRKQKLTQQVNASTPTLINSPMGESPSKPKSGKLRRKAQRQTSQPLGAPVGWPLKDETAAHELPTEVKDKTIEFNFTNHVDDSPLGQQGDFEKGNLDAAPQNHVAVPDTGLDTFSKANKDDKGRFERFKRMMKFSKKQKGSTPGTETVN